MPVDATADWLTRPSQPQVRHAHSTRSAHRSWLAMTRRCLNPKARGYEHYGGRGIAVCDRWLTFENFLADMGERPEWATGGIDRIDVDGNYEPGNCRWATAKQQAANRRRPEGSS